MEFILGVIIGFVSSELFEKYGVPFVKSVAAKIGAFFDKEAK